MEPTRTGERSLRLSAGLVLYGVSIALMLEAGLGVDSWDVFHKGLSELSGITFGWVVNGVSVVVLLIWIPLRQRPGIGTIANALVVGVVADITLSMLGTPGSVSMQWVMLIIGVASNGLATGLYIGAGLGPGPRDGLMTGLASRTGRSLRSIRTGIEVAVLAVGWILGGPVGWGTLVYAVSIGPLVQLFMARLALDGSPELPARPLTNLEGCPA